jgi:arylsulfatase A
MPTSRDRPNIVFILADDMGYGDFSAFNGGLSRTPTLDALIDESVCLTQHYTSSCVCNPSRATLLTGRYPHRTGSIDTLEWWGLERLALRERTLADVLQGMGYATGLVGKWHLGAFDPRYHPNARGFDEAVCFRGGMHDYYNWRLEFNDRVERADGRYLTDVWTDEAVGFIARHHNEPFFLHRMDTGIARILDALQEYGLEENTILCFTSDNGPQFGGQGERSTTRYNCQFHGAKGSVYEGGIRVPMLIRWPAGLKGGRTFDDMVHFSDWFPTLLATVGGEVPAGRTIDGVNVLPALRGEVGKVETRRFWQWNRYRPDVTGNAAMRDGDWKLVRPAIREAMHVPDIHWLRVSMYGPEYFIENGVFQEPYPAREVPPPPPPELYNVAEDPLEQQNLAEEYPERARKMLRELETWFEEVEAERATIDDDW